MSDVAEAASLVDFRFSQDDTENQDAAAGPTGAATAEPAPETADEVQPDSDADAGRTAHADSDADDGIAESALAATDAQDGKPHSVVIDEETVSGFLALFGEQLSDSRDSEQASAAYGAYTLNFSRGADLDSIFVQGAVAGKGALDEIVSSEAPGRIMALAQTSNLTGPNGAALPAPDFTPTDDLFANQWHLLNTGQFGGTPGMDINVSTAWNDYHGTGVHVGIYDSGVQYDHHDLNGNYDAGHSVIIDGLAHDPYPDLANPDDAHGTNVAGLIGAENDGTGTVGVAFDSSLTGISIFDLTDNQLLQAMSQMNTFDVTNHSWGYTAPFADNILNTGNAFWSGFFASFESAADTGRGGLGTIIVHSAGNDRTNEFNSGAARDTNDSNFTNSRFVISVGAIDFNGFVTHYSTPGAAVFVSAPAGGADGLAGVWSTDYLGINGFNAGGGDGLATDDPFPDYDGVMNGTSAASPIVTGVVALMLEANPNLGWRDVQEILAYSARHVGTAVGTAHAGTWELYDWGFNGAHNWNGGGLHYSNDYGYGLVDATAAVRLAETWTVQSTSANETDESIENSFDQAVPDNNAAGVTYSFTFVNSYENYDIERVQLELDWAPAHTFVGDLVITLTSPDGLVSYLLNREGTAFGSSPFGSGIDLGNWVFTTNAFRGEDLSGTWTVNISDRSAGDTGTVVDVKLDFFGSYQTDNTYVYTNEYGLYAGQLGHSQALVDSNGGVDTINAATVTTASTINLTAGQVSTIAGQNLTIDAATIIENAYGGDGDDVIVGNSSDNVINGGRGNDVLNGAAGIDQLFGSFGNDTFIVANAGDKVFESVGQGSDRVFASVTYTLAAGQSIEWLATTSQAGAAAISLTGNEFGQVVNGNNGNNVLDGKGGADSMYGHLGNDTFRVDNAGDRVFESAGQGNDVVFSSISYVLAAGQEIETLGTNAVAGTTAVNLTGNEFGQVVNGNNGNNVLDGKGGVDDMHGHGGNDIYRVDNAGDKILEFAGQGNDTVFSSVSYVLAAGQSIELLGTTSVAGTGAINLTGNAVSQTLNGNNGNNVLDGKGGADSMYGHLGNDTFRVDNSGDKVFESAGQGSDSVFASVSYTLAAGQSIELLGTTSVAGTTAINLTGNANNQTVNGNNGANSLNGGGGNDHVFGNAGNDVVNGGLGNDSLTGGANNDVFFFNTALNAATNVDAITDFSVPNDTIRLENAVFTALVATGTLAAAAFHIGGAAADASDRIIYNSATGALSYDSDGTGAAAAIRFATVAASLAMTNADFTVV